MILEACCVCVTSLSSRILETANNCKLQFFFLLQMKQLEPRHYGLQLRRLVDENTEYCAPEPYEYIVDQESVTLLS